MTVAWRCESLSRSTEALKDIDACLSQALQHSQRLRQRTAHWQDNTQHGSVCSAYVACGAEPFAL